ncbi:MAG: recombination protein RecR [Candidatus Marinimicrobia bacterium]|nr:recombination protein RecR [Candidatus Neomarinimicrobiota bacterium]
MSLPEQLNRLIDLLSKFPGIGKKTAQRLAFHILKAPRDEAILLAKTIVEVKDNIKTCSICFNITTTDPCHICTNPKRDHSMICVVQEAMDIISIEKTGWYNGLYHVLGGVISPLDGIGPDDLNISGLLNRLDGIREIILALNPTRQGETTAIYLSRLLKPKGVKVTKLAYGLPIGVNLEFADEMTLLKALEGRTEI